VELPDGKKHRSAIWNALGVYRGIRHGQKEENKMELEQGLKQFSSVGGEGFEFYSRSDLGGVERRGDF
jgi:hypothetical protein